MKVKESERKKEEEEIEEEDEEEAEEEDGEPSAETDNVGDPSVEINVEQLIHELEVDGVTPRREQAAKRRLEELMERKRSKRDLEDFDDYEVIVCDAFGGPATGRSPAAGTTPCRAPALPARPQIVLE